MYDCSSYYSFRPTEEVIELALEMTLDEWKAQQEQSRPKVELNIRKADTSVPSKAVVIHKSKFLQVRSLFLKCWIQIHSYNCCSHFRNILMAWMKRMWFSAARPMTSLVNLRSTLAAWLGPLVVGEEDEVVVAVGLHPCHP